MTAKANPANRHHYIPKFYLKRWCREDGKLCEFSRPYKEKVVPRRVHPSGTGYLDRLYAIQGLPDAVADIAETAFFKPVDGSAADALALLERDGNAARWNARLRSAWSRFVYSLLLRCPEDLEAFRTIGTEFAQKATDGRKQILSDADVDTATMEAVATMIDSPNIGKRMNSINWKVIDFPDDAFELLTSDRPVMRSDGIEAPDGHIALPIGPRRLFLASPHRAVMTSITTMNRRQLAKQINLRIVEGAARFVYGSTDNQLNFVAKHFGERPTARLVEITLASGKQIDE